MPKELERTFLLRSLPDLSGCKSKDIVDVYVPASRVHPTLRIRKNGVVYEITKKSPVRNGDSSIQMEDTISLDADEFDALVGVKGKHVHKIRYYYPHNGHVIEIGVFVGALEGLVLADVEFENEPDMKGFNMPDFFLADVTQEDWAAGGMLCGKSYKDVEKHLKRFGYKKLRAK